MFKKKKLTYHEWLSVGVENGFCSLPHCATHDGIPSHESEERAFEEGSDPCQVIVRLGGLDDWEVPEWWFDSGEIDFGFDFD